MVTSSLRRHTPLLYMNIARTGYSFFLPAILFIFSMGFAQAQVETVGEIQLLDYHRIKQTTDSTSEDHNSYQVRSTHTFFLKKDLYKPILGKDFKYFLGSFTLTHRENDDMNVSNNDGSMLPAAGMQQRASINFGLNYKRFYLNLAPEWLNAENRALPPFVYESTDPNYYARYYLYHVNKIDMYWRFGKNKINQFLPGQSSLRYQDDHLSFGISTENLWWGPSLRNSLVMSNNANGFPHLTLNTVKPKETKMGRIEAQAIFGKLQNPSMEHPDNETMKNIWRDGIYFKDTVPRYTAGFVVSWEPKWTPNFYIGMSSTISGYMKGDDKRLVAYPLFGSRKPIKMGALFFRYVMPKDNTELYAEFGRADKMATPLNLIRDSIPLGYTAGVRKFIPLTGGKSHLYMGIEVSRLEMPEPRLVFAVNAPFGLPLTNSWYTGSEVRQGYTNNGQVMGAWAGPGSNSQTLQLGWVKGFKKISLTGERVQHNNDFYYYNYLTAIPIAQYQNPNKHWADISITGQIQWDVRNLLLNAAWSYTKMINYRWTKLDGGFSGRSELSDRENTQIQFSATWFFYRDILKK